MIAKTTQTPAASGKIVGYMRVSRSRQNTARQEDAMAVAKIATVFSDKMSGRKWNRAGLDAALAAIQLGGRLAVEAIDRLGRTALEILLIIEQLHARGASLVSLSQHCDSATRNGRIQILFHAVFAEIEYETISGSRTSAPLFAALASWFRLEAARDAPSLPNNADSAA